jgi:uncharacterized protein YaiL (DUF2058 family)
MRNALQDQLLKAGLAKKSKVDQIAREQAKQRQQKAAPAADVDRTERERLRREHAERDRALQAERNAQSKAQELRAQARQIIEQNRLPIEGDSDYRFTDGKAIRSLLVTPAMRKQLAKGTLLIARIDDSYAVVPRAAADKVVARDPSMIVLDHAQARAPSAEETEDEFYRRFAVPDDLVW